ncbi:MAG: hypothetical protein OEY94_02890 [Alphaproteobacteria bacterium]|nr:hypothetical protein [Alphaproteobacteria bacterium]
MFEGDITIIGQKVFIILVILLVILIGPTAVRDVYRKALVSDDPYETYKLHHQYGPSMGVSISVLLLCIISAFLYRIYNNWMTGSDIITDFLSYIFLGVLIIGAFSPIFVITQVHLYTRDLQLRFPEYFTNKSIYIALSFYVFHLLTFHGFFYYISAKEYGWMGFS